MPTHFTSTMLMIIMRTTDEDECFPFISCRKEMMDVPSILLNPLHKRKWLSFIFFDNCCTLILFSFHLVPYQASFYFYLLALILYYSYWKWQIYFVIGMFGLKIYTRVDSTENESLFQIGFCLGTSLVGNVWCNQNYIENQWTQRINSLGWNL